MRKLKIGLLPLYIKLYDDFSYYRHADEEKFYAQIADALEEKGLEVHRAPVCRILPEFSAAVSSFEADDVDALVTLNLAYSPSLESASVLAKTRLPIIVLDTTRDEVFDENSDPDLIDYNHGIHGVQDLCNLLTRNHKPYSIACGFWKYGKVLDETVAYVRAAAAAKNLSAQRVGQAGKPFAGMGDFSITPEEYAKLGITVKDMDVPAFHKLIEAVTQEELDEAAKQDAEDAIVECDRKAEDAANRVAIALRRWIRDNQLTAFSVNFLGTSADGITAMPFMEACRAMRDGIGYAGEGDTLTASLVGAMLPFYPETTFGEMFCPDWKNNTIYLSHMGEVNLRLLKPRPRLCRFNFKYTSADDTAALYGTFKPGKATIINLCPLGDGKFRMILVPIEILDIPTDNASKDTVNGWFRTSLPVDRFLKEYSLAGGTHHSAISYGVSVEEMSVFANALGFEIKVIG